MDYVKAFLIGGLICAIGQVLIDYTKLTPARILVAFVVIGVFLTGIGVYEKLVEFAGNGATTPIVGFGYSLANGVKKAVAEQGFMGVLAGGLKATAPGISATVIAALLAAIISRPKTKG